MYVFVKDNYCCLLFLLGDVIMIMNFMPNVAHCVPCFMTACGQCKEMGARKVRPRIEIEGDRCWFESNVTIIVTSSTCKLR